MVSYSKILSRHRPCKQNFSKQFQISFYSQVNCIFSVIGPGTISNSQLRIHVSATNSSMTQDACLSGKDLQMRTKMDELTNFMGGLTTENVTNQTITNTLNFETARNDALQIELTELLTNESAIIDFNIDTTERMNRIIVLIFEKTIDEPNSVAYAQLCHKLSKKSFAINAQSPKLFLKTLIGKCQNEFENHVIVESEGLAENLQSILQKIAETTDVDRKAEYEANYDEEKRKIRRRSVGTVRFIGELFKLGMLTPAIMIHCVSKLLDRNSEDKLECACKLLTTIGGRLEDKKNFLHFHALREYFRQMQEIVDRTNESSQISRRVRFLIQDVIDLRKNNWITRKEVASAKKEKHIQYRRRLMLSKVTSNC